MFDPNDEIQRERLFTAVESSYRLLEPFRNLNRSLVEEYAGSGYGQTRQKHEIMINLMNQAVDAYTMALVANRPRVMLSTRREELYFFAKQFELALNNFLEEIGIEYTLRQWVLDAFFCVGIIKVHMADSGLVQLENDLWMDPGKPFASNVNLDNWVHDMSATKWEQVKFAGDCYRIPFDDLKSGVYDQEAAKDLMPTSKFSVGEERLAQISRGMIVDDDEFEPMIDLIDLWLPRDNRIYTFACDMRTLRPKGPPLAVMDWTGPEFGPYHLLGFNDVPENIMPTSPASHTVSLCRLANNIMRKQAKRARNAKRVHTYTPAGAKQSQTMKNAMDDQFIEVADPKDFGSMELGGVDPANQAFLLGVVEMFDRMAGNLPAMMGLGAQTDTASQEKLIHSAVSKKEAQMQYRVVDGARRVIRDLAHMLWNDRIKVIPGQYEVQGAEGIQVDATWTPDDREGDFSDYNFMIDVYSMPYQSPTQKVMALNQLLTQFYLPGAQLLMQQGGQMNFQKLLEIHADMLNMPQLKQVIQFVAGPQEMEPEGEMPGLPSATTRTYERRNVPTGGTMASRNMVQQQGWLGQASNPAQQNSLTRPPA